MSSLTVEASEFAKNTSSAVENVSNIEKSVLRGLQKAAYVGEIHPSHTKYGVGLGTVQYPTSVARERLKKGDNPRPYKPVRFTADVVRDSIWAPGKPPAQSWADPDHPSKIQEQLDNGRKRTLPFGTSKTGMQYEINAQGIPENPLGKTGIIERGLLGLWGPNPAADPIVFRIHSGKLKVLLVQRADNGEWAIPGGMLDPTDPKMSMAALRELKEETGLSMQDFERNSISLGKVYSGYADDPRNTDNAWMETNAYVWLLKSHAKTDTMGPNEEVLKSHWVDVLDLELASKSGSSSFPLFASHKDFIRLAVTRFLDYHSSSVPHHK